MHPALHRLGWSVIPFSGTMEKLQLYTSLTMNALNISKTPSLINKSSFNWSHFTYTKGMPPKERFERTRITSSPDYARMILDSLSENGIAYSHKLHSPSTSSDLPEETHHYLHMLACLANSILTPLPLLHQTPKY